MDNCKIEKLKSLTNEVKDFHPLLKSVFENDSTILRFEYTHGKDEMGADFVLARSDQTLRDENYVGVIVKCGNIKQDYADIKRQIEECSVERFFDGAKRKIYLNETWIVCNGNISNGAQRKIFAEYKSRNIKFIDIEHLALLVDRNYPYFWNAIPAGLGTHLKSTLFEITKAESYNTLGTHFINLDIAQELYKIEPTQPKQKIFRYNNSLRTTLDGVLKQHKLVLIEGWMGSGKTTLFRKHIKALCEPDRFQANQIIPKLVHFADIAEDVSTRLARIIKELQDALKEAMEGKILLFIDGVDEVKSLANGSFLDVIKEVSKMVQDTKNLAVVIGSRPVWTIEEGEGILRLCPRFRILPLSLEQIIKVIQNNCSSLVISEKLRHDLGTHYLLRVIPRTPMSAIILARVLNANAKEIPQTLPELYSKYVELALGRWDIDKGLMTEKEYPVVIAVLSRVAEYMLNHELQRMSVDEVTQMFGQYTKTREGLPSPTDILARIEQRSEVIIINHDEKTFAFRHKSLAEFLLAIYRKETHGRNAPFENPFEGYWLGVEYFYLGLIQDAGERLEKLSNLVLSTEREKVFRILNLGNLMLSAYQTEYAYIEQAVYKIVIEMTDYFLDVRSGKIKSGLSVLPEMQLFVSLSYVLRDSLEYQYFKKALVNAQIECQYAIGLSNEQRAISSFFIDVVRTGLGDTDTFEFLTTQDLSALPWVVKLGIQHIVQDDKVELQHVTKLVKKIKRAYRNNPGLNKSIVGLYELPMMKTIQKLD